MLPEIILQNFQLSQTNIRMEILNILNNSNMALSMNEIKLQLTSNYDRVTLYRNLKVLTEKGILHQVFFDRHDSKYVLPPKPGKSENGEEHLHFKCLMCKKVKCLTDQHPEPVNLPEGYEKIEVNFVVFGICQACKNKN